MATLPIVPQANLGKTPNTMLNVAGKLFSGALGLASTGVSSFLGNFKIYAIVALLATVAGGAGYVTHLYFEVSIQRGVIAAQVAREAALQRSIAALEKTVATRAVTKAKTETVKKAVVSAKEAPVPDAIARALDGLRQLQQPKSKPGGS